MGVLYVATIGIGSHQCLCWHFIYTYVGLSALLVSTTWAMPEPLLRGTSDRDLLHVFSVYEITKNNWV